MSDPRARSQAASSPADGGPSEALLQAFRRAVRAKIEADLRREAEAAEAMRAEVMAGLREVVADARGRGLSAPVWLFGSFAWGAPDRWSDVDLAVPTAADAELLGRACDGRVARDVHLVALDAAAPTLGERVRAEGLAL